MTTTSIARKVSIFALLTAMVGVIPATALAAGVPIALTQAATNVGAGFANLTGLVTPNGADTTASFEYGTSPSFGQISQSQTVSGSASTQTVSLLVTGLQTNTLYYYQLRAQNQYGSTQGGQLTFFTSNTGSNPGSGVGSAPSVITSPTGNVSGNYTVTFSGLVNPNNSPTNVYFEYGTTQYLGQTTGNQTLSAGNTYVTVAAPVTSLFPNSYYYFRVVAQNSYGRTQGNIQSFSTGGTNTGGNQNCMAYDQYGNCTNYNNGNPNYGTCISYDIYGNCTNYSNSGNSQNCQTRDVYGNCANYGNYPQNYQNCLTYDIYGNCTNYGTPGNSFGTSQPTAYTNSAISINSGGATMQGSVNPMGVPTTVSFEYGPTSALGHIAGGRQIGSDNNAQTYTVIINGLRSGTTYYYRLVAKNAYGTARGSILSFTTTGGVSVYVPPVPPGNPPATSTNAPAVYTNLPSDITDTAVTLRGSADPNDLATTAWFEYGTSDQLGQRAGERAMGSTRGTKDYTLPLAGLAPGTTYYYRAVGENAKGVTRGTTVSFRTTGAAQSPAGGQTSPTPVTPAPNQPGTNIDVSASPSVDKANPVPGEDVTYTIAYRNANAMPVSNFVLSVVLPPEVEYRDSSPKASMVSANGLIFNLGTLGGGQSGTITTNLRVRKGLATGVKLNVLAIANYADNANQPHAISAPLTVAVAEPTPSDQLASTSGGFGGGAIFWLLVGVFIVAVVNFLYIFSRDRNTKSRASGRYVSASVPNYPPYQTTAASVGAKGNGVRGDL